jgi:hypothetical protein
MAGDALSPLCSEHPVPSFFLPRRSHRAWPGPAPAPAGTFSSFLPWSRCGPEPWAWVWLGYRAPQRAVMVVTRRSVEVHGVLSVDYHGSGMRWSGDTLWQMVASCTHIQRPNGAPMLGGGRRIHWPLWQRRSRRRDIVNTVWSPPPTRGGRLGRS